MSKSNIKPPVPGRAPSKANKLEEAYELKLRELAELEELSAVKSTVSDAAWEKLFLTRQTICENMLTRLDSNDILFRCRYDKYQAISDEYRLLRGLLADPDKRIAKVKTELDEISKEVKRLKVLGGEVSGQY